MFRRFRRFLTLVAIGDVLFTLAALALADFLRSILAWGRPLGEQGYPLVAPLIYGVVALVWPVAISVSVRKYLFRRHWQTNSQVLPVSISTMIQVSLPRPIRMHSIHKKPKQSCTLSRRSWLK